MYWGTKTKLAYWSTELQQHALQLEASKKKYLHSTREERILTWAGNGKAVAHEIKIIAPD